MLLITSLITTPILASPFTDVQDKSVEYAYENNLMKGMTQTTFVPNATLTRSQFATTLHNLVNEKVDTKNPTNKLIRKI